MADESPILTIRDLVVGYRGVPLLEGVNGGLMGGETLMVIGANGSGKSTLIRTIVGIQPAISGAVQWAPKAAIAYVGQRQADAGRGPVRVIDSVRSGLTAAGNWWRPGYVRRHESIVADSMAACDVDALAMEQVTDLSEGQKQRVMLARALAGRPSVLVLDEPTAAMDATNEAQTFALLRRLQTERELTLLIVSHRVAAVNAVADRGLFADRSESRAAGAVVWGAVPEIWSNPVVARAYPVVAAAMATRPAQ